MLLLTCCRNDIFVCTAICGAVDFGTYTPRTILLLLSPPPPPPTPQVRIHSASACEFYLRVRSRPIIEHSTNLAFAPYAAETLLLQEEPGGSHQQEQQHQQQQPAQAADCKQQQQEQGQQQRRQGGGVVDNWQPAKLLSAAQLLDDSGLWQRVDDFGWVKASASPHWGVLPECERQQPPQCLPDAAASEQ